MHRLGLKGPDPLHLTAGYPRFDRTKVPKQLPPEVMYDEYFPNRYNQEEVGACGLFSSGALYEAVLAKHLKKPVDVISKRAFYALTQANYEQSGMNRDEGVYLVDALNVLEFIGHVQESAWPEQSFPGPDYFDVPDRSLISMTADIEGFQRVGGFGELSAESLHDKINAALYAHGPLVFGGEWANDWYTPDAHGYVTPNPTQGSAGGHARVYVGYDDAKEARLVLNSWGREWGRDGFYWEPYNVATEFLPTDVYALVVPA